MSNPIRKINIQTPGSATPIEVPIGAYAEDILMSNEVGADDLVTELAKKLESSDLPGDFGGASTTAAGTHGLVPAPALGDQDKFLKADGTWATAAGGNTINNVADGTGERAVVEGAVTSGTSGGASYNANIASGNFSHAEGLQTTASGNSSHAEGHTTLAYGNGSHAEGLETKANGTESHAEGKQTLANGTYSHAEGQLTTTWGQQSHAEGYQTSAVGNNSHAEGLETTASGTESHAEGCYTLASDEQSHAEGYRTSASGNNSHAEGSGTKASGVTSHAEGGSTEAIGNYSHAEGSGSSAIGVQSHAEGSDTKANGPYSHAEGCDTIANGDSAHAEGCDTKATGEYSHAEGNETSASGDYSHAEGNCTIAGYDNQHVQGTYNDNKATTLFEIGNGTGSSAKNNAFEVYNDGSLSTDNGTTKVKLQNLIPTSQKGAASGVAELDANGKVPSSQLPSYVDDVIEVTDYASLPTTGEAGKIYITLDDNKTYRWSGTTYVEISSSLALGETDSTAYRGDRGKTAYDHATESGKISSAVIEGLYKIAATAQGHIASTTAVTKSDITALGIPGEAKEYEATTASIGSASGWSAGSVTDVSVSGDTLNITVGTAPSLTVTSTTVATGIQEKT